jgi:hypothetical protein
MNIQFKNEIIKDETKLTNNIYIINQNKQQEVES